jgi:hypothetical protein
MLHRVFAALLALLVVCVPGSHAQQDLLTLDNFTGRYTSKGLVGVDFGPFDCSPDIFNRSDTFCFNQVSGGDANVIYRGSTSSRTLTYTSVLVYHPDKTSQSGLFLGLCIRMLATLSPELKSDEIMEVLLAVTKVPNSERRVGPWVYRIERQALNIALHAQRLGGQPTPSQPADPQRVRIERGNPLACRERADMERVMGTILQGQSVYMELVAGLIFTGKCTQINRGSQVVVLERFAPKNIARVRRWADADTNSYGINAMYIDP